jgi:hypothetical protein
MAARIHFAGQVPLLAQLSRKVLMVGRNQFAGQVSLARLSQKQLMVVQSQSAGLEFRVRLESNNLRSFVAVAEES